jgi:prophage antirepressor-like protein
MALVLLQQQMSDKGMMGTAEQERDKVASIVRSVLFKKVKFCVPSLMKTGGKVAMKVYKHMGEDYPNKKEYDELWEDWIKKHVRNSLNEKRSAVNQAVHKSLVRGKCLN